jgi:hypothetical protein
MKTTKKRANGKATINEPKPEFERGYQAGVEGYHITYQAAYDAGKRMGAAYAKVDGGPLDDGGASDYAASFEQGFIEGFEETRSLGDLKDRLANLDSAGRLS